MIERCDTCTGETRKACDVRFSKLARLTCATELATTVAAEKDSQTLIKWLDTGLSVAYDRTADALKENGCDLSPEQALGRIGTEVEFRTWEKPLPHEVVE